MKKSINIIIIFAFVSMNTVPALSKSQAATVEIQNNGNNSSNTISIQQQPTQIIQQNNTLQINNTVNSNAQTGNNTSSGNTNGNTTIQTGNANTNVTITNQGNVNIVESTKNPIPTIMPSPTKTLNNEPQPTSKPSSPSSSQPNGPQQSHGSNGSTQNGGIGGGEVKGLAATSSANSFSLFSSIGGFLCLFIGSALLGKKE